EYRRIIAGFIDLYRRKFLVVNPPLITCHSVLLRPSRSQVARPVRHRHRWHHRTRLHREHPVFHELIKVGMFGRLVAIYTEPVNSYDHDSFGLRCWRKAEQAGENEKAKKQGSDLLHMDRVRLVKASELPNYFAIIIVWQSELSKPITPFFSLSIQPWFTGGRRSFSRTQLIRHRIK